MKKNFHSKIFSMSSAVVISRIFGLIRDIIFTGLFGVSYIADAFNYAYRIPNLLRGLFGEGALAGAFIPIYGEVGQKHGKKAQIRLGLNILSILALFLSILCILGFFLAPLVVDVMAPGLAQETTLLTIKLTRIMMPYLFLIGLATTIMSILNYHNYFFLPALSSTFFNIGTVIVIIGFTYLSKSSSIEKVTVYSFGIIFGGILQLLMNLPLLKKIGYQTKFIFKNDYFRKIWSRFLPGIIGMGVRQINIFIDLFLASFLIVGSASGLTYSYRLMQLALGVFGVPIWTTSLPLFSKLVAKRQFLEIKNTLTDIIDLATFLMLPITVLMITLGKSYISVLFFRGLFDNNALEMTYRPYVFYVLGLLVFCYNHIFTTVFFAFGDTKTPLKIATFTMVLNIIFNLIFMQYLQAAGLALATFCSAVVQSMILYTLLRKKIENFSFWSSEMFKIFLSSLCLYVVITFGIDRINFSQNFAGNLSKVLFFGLIGILLFIFFAFIFRVKKLRTLKNFILAKSIRES